MAANLSPVPLRNVLTDAKTWLVNSVWARWLVALVERLNITPAVLASVSVASASAATTTTAYMTPSLLSGLYRVSYTLYLTRAATTSSSMTPTIAWTCNGQSMSTSGAAMAGNTLTTQESGTVVLCADAATSITYAVSYASVGATSATYSFLSTVEAVL